MKRRVIASILLTIVLCNPSANARKAIKIDPLKTLSRPALTDKIKGGWAGKIIGVSYGLSNPPLLHPGQLPNAFKQPELYIQMTFVELLDKNGLNVSSQQFGESLKNTRYELRHAAGAARRNLDREMIAPWSGSPLYNAHFNDNDFQSEADFIGLMCPNLPIAADTYSIRIGRVMNYGDGVFGGMWVSGMYSAAYFETDPAVIVEEGLKRLPEQSAYAEVIKDVILWHKQDANNWTNCWQKLRGKWEKQQVCPESANSSHNNDAKLNGGFIAMGLLYGNGDFSKALEITARAGQETQSNCGSVAGILGVVLGYNNIPEQWKAGVAKTRDEKFLGSSYTLDGVVQVTEKRALDMILDAGGKVTATDIAIPSLKRTPLMANVKNEEQEANFNGLPAKPIALDNRAWKWKGDWAIGSHARTNRTNGCEATFQFTGVGIAIRGLMNQQSGRADVFVDGEPHFFSMDGYVGKEIHDNVLWHAFGLTNGVHTVRIVPRGNADPHSTGNSIVLTDAVVYE